VSRQRLQPNAKQQAENGINSKRNDVHGDVDVMREQLEVMAFPPKPCGSIRAKAFCRTSAECGKAGTKYFVMFRVSGTAPRAIPWGAKMAMHRGGGQRGGAIWLRSWAISCCFLVWLYGSLES